MKKNHFHLKNTSTSHLYVDLVMFMMKNYSLNLRSILTQIKKIFNYVNVFNQIDYYLKENFYSNDSFNC